MCFATNGNITLYIYDETGVIGMQYHASNYDTDVWDVYWYEKNLQGDITGIYNESGEKYISYYYDAFGNCYDTYEAPDAHGCTAEANPFRYRGYYYDSDLGLYYLNSRYYDSYTGRFISPDTSAVLAATPTALTDKNLYAYCDNNPVMRADNGGDFWHMLIGGIIGVASQFCSDLITSAIEGEFSTSHWSEYAGAFIGGMVGQLFSMTPFLGDVVGAAVATVVTSNVYNVESLITGRSEYYSFEETYYSTVNNVIISSVGGGFVLGMSQTKLGNTVSSLFSNQEFKNYAFDFLRGLGSSIFDGITNSSDFTFPSKHIWKTPNVERWYPFR